MLLNRRSPHGGGRRAEARATRCAAFVFGGGPLRFYATCVCLAQVALTTPLAFEQPGQPLLDVDLPLPLSDGGGYDRRPPAMAKHWGPNVDADASTADAGGGSFNDRGIAVLLDEEVELPPPRLHLPGDRPGFSGGVSSGGFGYGHVDYYHPLLQQQHRNAPLPLPSGDAEGGDGVHAVLRTISPPSIEMKGDGRTLPNRSYPLKSYVDRRASQHQRVLFVKSKVRELLKQNSTTSKIMQPAPPASPAAVGSAGVHAQLNGALSTPLVAATADRLPASAGGPSGAVAAAPSASDAAAAGAAGANAGGAQYAALEATAAGQGISWGQQPVNQQQQQQHLTQALVAERLAIAPPCVHEQPGGNPADSRSAHVSVPVAPASGAVQRTVVTASLYLFFHARPTENKTGQAEEKLTVLLQQTVPCGRATTTSGVRRFRRVVGHMRVQESYVGYVRFNLNRVLSSCPDGGGKSRWLIVSVLNSTGHLINAREFFSAGPCSAESDTTAAAAAASAVSDSSWRAADEEYSAKLEEVKNWKATDRAGGSESGGAQPKNYVEMTVAIKRA